MKIGDCVEYKTAQHTRRLRGGILKGFSWAAEDGWISVYNPNTRVKASVAVTNLVFFRVLPATAKKNFLTRTFECRGCGEMITTNIPHQHWCSAACRSAYWRKQKNG